MGKKSKTKPNLPSRVVKRAAPRLAPGDLIAVTCFFGSGFLALVYEICWIRKATLVFGATTYALSAVLAVFFGGLALGSFLLGRYSIRARRPLRVYAVLEWGVGLLALASPLAFAFAETLFGAIYPSVQESFVALTFVRLAFIVAIVLPPTILMGGTLPLFCQQYIRSEHRISRGIGLLYGLNTLGAAVGCAICGFVLIPRVGVEATIYLAGAFNLMLGFVVWMLPQAAIPLPVAQRPTEAEQQPRRTALAPSNAPVAGHVVPTIHGLFFLTGLVALANEIVWTRYLALLLQNTVSTYTLTLFVILLGIVLGSAIYAWLHGRVQRRAFAFGLIQAASALSVLTVLMLPASWWNAWLDATDLRRQILIIALLLLVPAVLSGISFPLAMSMVVRDPRIAGLGVGRMSALNTAGGIVGSLAVGFLVLPRLGLQATLIAVTCVSLLVAVAAWLLLESSLSRPMRYALVVASLGLWLAIPRVTGTRLPHDFLSRGREMIAVREGLTSQMAVVRARGQDTLEIDRLWQGTDRKTHQIMAAHVPMILHGDAKRVLVVGLGTGQGPSRFLMHEIEQLDVVEIERELVPLVRSHFDSEWMDDPRTRFIIEDGRNFLTHTDQTYDLISIEVGQVFRPRLASFYTAEFYHRARRRLREGGLLCQFVPIKMFSTEEFRTVVQTFLDAFPNSILWYNTAELLLIGSNSKEMGISPASLALLVAEGPMVGDLEYAHWGGPAHFLNQPDVFLAGFLTGPQGLRTLAGDAPIYRDDLPYLEYTTLQPRDEDAQRSIELIESVLEPAQSIVDTRLEQNAESSIDAVRRQNLRAIISDMWKIRSGLLLADGHSQAAIDLLRTAHKWNPNDLEVNEQLAAHSAKVRDFDAAATYFHTIARLKLNDPIALYNLGTAHLLRGDVDVAAECFVRAVEEDPDYVIARSALADLHLRRQQFADAADQLREILRIGPDSAEFRMKLGAALLRNGAPQEGLAQFQRAAEIEPQSADARYRLALAFESQGEVARAVTEFRGTLELDPEAHNAANSLAWILSTSSDPALRNAEEALHWARRCAAAADHAQHHVLDTLAAAHAQAGNFDDAVRWQQRAITMAPDADKPELEARLKLYRSGNPFRQSPAK